MVEYRIHDPESAPAASAPLLEGVEKKMGFVPNILGALAESPAALKAYLGVAGAFETATLSPLERQVVMLVTSFENDCRYCMAAHSTMAAMQEVPAEVIDALREGGPLSDPRLEALRAFTRAMVRERGHTGPREREAFLSAGFTAAQALEVVAGIAMKTLSNYADHLMDPPLDPGFEAMVWSGPPATCCP